MNNVVKQEDKGRFVQYPLHLIYGCPELNRDDKWVLLAIMGECWSRGPHKLSYRDIAKLSGVPISLLSSTKGKNGKPDKEGIIDRLARLGKIKLDFGKEVVSGKPKGNAQTFIYVEYDLIWQDNVTYCEEKRPNKTKEQYRCEKESYQPVPNTNRLESTEVVEPVRIANEPVLHTNKPVLHTNTSVPYTNEPVRDVSSKVPPYITDINTTKDKEEESVAPSVALPSTFQLSLSVSSQEEQSPIVKAATGNGQSKSSSKKSVRVTKQRNTEPLKKAAPKVEDMSPEAQCVWGEWITLPWFQGMAPKFTETASTHCEYLAKSKEPITRQVILDTRNFAKKNDRSGFYKNKSWELGDVVREYPRWQSAGYQAQTDPSSPLQATIVDMDAERERVRIKNEQQLAKQQEMRRKRAELAKQGVNNG